MRQGTEMRQYVGLIQKDEGSDFGVSFPDFPGVVTAGKSLGESLELAEDALTFHVEGMIEDGQAIPYPTSIEGIEADPNHGHQTAIFVRVKID
ncbi:type II toxin-antitoxin system HicB family antitoxin [Mesorhizobium sp.]|uniref:type II toxin-antitoxin system HicB family antitoxin n=1 Tax=Mesorhizobium sp. TaxID=1871066 RepID=UPI0025C2C3BB|nr:type II toxin-antitoxin system HicB family antitoxin [Mesorhizobium sp.]